ncbi:MAG: OmpA family protein, partial [Bacteroidota bacterium]
AENLEKSLESMKEKDLQIKSLRDAVNKRDSVTLALVTSIKGALGNLSDQDIEVNVEKGVVFISISDKLLFTSGSYTISESAKSILGKIATIMKNKPDIDFMVEGHTDNVPIKQSCISDNWELSVLRATAVVKVLQDDFEIAPERMTAAGRSYYVPLVENTNDQNKARNRRTRIVVLPKLDQFYDMVEKGMEEAKANSQGE